MRIGELVSILYCCFINQHHRNVVLNRIDALARGAFERGPVFDQGHRRFAVGARENFEQFGIDGHAPNYMTPPRFYGTIH